MRNSKKKVCMQKDHTEATKASLDLTAQAAYLGRQLRSSPRMWISPP